MLQNIFDKKSSHILGDLLVSFIYACVEINNII